ncbi:hypothetical protein ACWCQK_05260 [Streptomyces sp. NPDC002306]
MSAESLAAQAAAITCLAGLAVRRPHLPAAYIVLSDHAPRELIVQLDSPVAVELWREALCVDPGRMRVNLIGDQLSLGFDASAYGLDFRVYAVFESAVVEAGAS